MPLSKRSLLVLVAMFCFALMAVFTRGAGASILAISAWRAVIVAVLFVVWSVVAEGNPRALVNDRQTLKLGVIYGLALALASSTFVGGYALTTVAHTIFLHGLAPAMAFPLAWWAFKERPSTATIAGAGLAIVGVGMLSGVSLFNFAHFTNPRFLMGDFLAFLSAVGYAAVLVVTRATRNAGTPILGTLGIAWVVASVVLIAIAMVFGELGMPSSAWLWVIGLAVISTAVPFYLLNVGMKEVSAGMASLLSMSEVVFATGIGLLVYHEALAPVGWFGGILVVLGVLYPFVQREDEEGGEEVAAIDEHTAKFRSYRLGLALFLLNSSAVVVLTTGNGLGALLAWAAVVMVVRLGPGLAARALEGRYVAGLRWGTCAVATGVVAGVAMRGGWEETRVSVVVVLAALAGWMVDQWLASQETEEWRDTQPLFATGMVLVCVGQLVALMGHPAVQWLNVAGAACIALQAWGVFSVALKGPLTGRSFVNNALVSRLDAFPQTFTSPVRLIGVTLVLFVVGGISTVPAGYQGVVERFGRPLDQTSEPGLLFRFPPPIEAVTLVDMDSVRRRVIMQPGTNVLTGDQAMVSISAVLHFTVSDAKRYALYTVDPDVILHRIARSSLVEVVAHLPQDSVLTDGRKMVEERVARSAQEVADRLGLGLRVSSVQITNVAVPAPVLASFLDVISADEEKRTLINLAEAYAAEVLPKAFGTSVARVQGTEGDSVLRLTRAKAYSLWFKSVADNAKASMGVTKTRIRMETFEDLFGHRSLVLAPSSIRVWVGDDDQVTTTAEKKGETP